jgi:hypothetical protein
MPPTATRGRSIQATKRRKPLYNLYHILNHFNLFGGAYLGSGAAHDRSTAEAAQALAQAALTIGSSCFCNSPDWYISVMMSLPPTNSPAI